MGSRVNDLMHLAHRRANPCLRRPEGRIGDTVVLCAARGAATGQVEARKWGRSRMSSDELQTVAVTTVTSPTELGATVNAVVTITGDPDRKVRGAEAQLVRTAIHRITQTNVLDHGNHDSLLQEEVVVTEASIASDGRVVPGEHLAILHIPEDGFPSATGQVRWSVRAVIDRRLGADVKAETPVEVLAGPERFASEATAEGRYKGERCIDLELSTRTLRPGRPLSATSSSGQRGQ